VTEGLSHPPVLMYHDLEELGAGGAGRRLLERQMVYLARHGYRTLTADGFMRAIDEGEWAPKSLLLTFDDGYRDFATEVYPILRDTGFTATVFLVADAIDGVATQWSGPRPARMPATMGWPEALALRGQGVSFGSHGLSHALLGGLAADELVEETAGSKARLEERLGEEVALFSYPYGDCSDAARAAVESAGYSAAFGVSPKVSERFEVFRRVVRPARSTFPFRLRVSRAYPALRRALHLVRGEA
jgi:peptidoglycan/xylan/chitin deacetylase (PgdA/CDA1 family)